ncbi:hypothetical protein L6164_034756 [Bauhinia variegata]|uniref:Uncharacterized protein n=1 Tax=Bauhinia variegata TaxID=167791 RepID=A0ACB9KVL2_BAUVA|nr:hypothetical protein L6164_034756 [Bauhinia variegata]
MGRAPCCEKVGLKKGRWTAEEDEILMKYIQANGEGSWRSLPKNAGLLRCGKSCRLRWINYLRADLKRGNISPQEEDVIIKLHASLGNRWSLIASHLPGRTDNEIKNYWNSHLSRRINTFRRANSSSDKTPMITDVHVPKARSDNIPPKRKGGKTSRWAMNKNKSYSTQNQKETEKPKESSVSTVNHEDENEKEAVPVPSTPALENEILSTNVEDFMSLEADQEDHKISDAREKESSTDQGFRSSSCSEGREGMQLEEQHPLEHEGINGGEVLCFIDTLDVPDWLLDDGGGIWPLTDERESSILNNKNNNDDVVGGGTGEESEVGRLGTCPNKMAASEEMERVNLSCSNEKREMSSGDQWFSCSSISTTSVFDDNSWDWESALQLDNIVDESQDEYSWVDNKEKLVSWLWEDDHDLESDSQNLGDIDPEKHSAMIAWFLSST